MQTQTQQRHPDVLTKLNAHDDTADDDAQDQHRAPHPERDPFVRGDGIRKVVFSRRFVSVEWLPLEALGDGRGHRLEGGVDGFPVAAHFGKARTEEHQGAWPNLVPGT